MKQCNSVAVQDISEVDINRLGTLPAFLFGVAQKYDEESGDVLSEPQLVPTERIVPHAANEFVLEANNPGLTVPEHQVLPAYLYNNGTSIRVMPADATHPALFVVTRVDGGLAVCQSTGVAFLPNGHEYRPTTVQHYLTNGEVSTAPGGQKLFVPLDDYQLLINL